MPLLPEPARRRRILSLALPLIGGMVSQNILNLVDTAMVGALGNEALAAVGLGSFANFMAVAFVAGLSNGVQATAARRHGEGKASETAVPLNGGLVMAAAFGLPISVGVFAFAPELFGVLADDAAVGAQGTDYLRARVVSVCAVGFNFAFRGYWNAVNLSRLYMRTLVFMHVANVILNYGLIFGHFGLPALGTTGAGLGTTLATLLGTGYYFILGRRHAASAGFLRRLPDRASAVTMVKLSLPSGAQNLLFATGMTVFYTIVGTIGTAELAAANVLVNLLLVGILPGIGFGLAAGSLVGQALGAGDAADARRWGWEVMRMGAVTMGIFAVPAIVWPELFLVAFLRDPSALALAALPLALTAASITLDTAGLILMNALLGAGDTRRVALTSIGLQWLLFLPGAWLLGPVFGFGLLAVWSAQLVYRAIQAVVFIRLWQGEAWARIEV